MRYPPKPNSKIRMMRRIITIPPEFLKESDAESCLAVGLEFERAGVGAQIRASRDRNQGILI
jgi:hypothetical protein